MYLLLQLCALAAFGWGQILPFGGDALQTDNPVSGACSTALTQTINCPTNFQKFAAYDLYSSFPNRTALDSFCGQDCVTSVTQYRSGVSSSCTGSSAEPWTGVPATYQSSYLQAVQNRTCLKDPGSGDYCMGELH